MAPEPFVPPGFTPPTSLVAERFRLEPLGPQHDEPDPADQDVIGCVHLYPSSPEDHDVTIQTWQRPDRCGR